MLRIEEEALREKGSVVWMNIEDTNYTLKLATNSIYALCYKKEDDNKRGSKEILKIMDYGACIVDSSSTYYIAAIQKKYGSFRDEIRNVSSLCNEDGKDFDGFDFSEFALLHLADKLRDNPDFDVEAHIVNYHNIQVKMLYLPSGYDLGGGIKTTETHTELFEEDGKAFIRKVGYTKYKEASDNGFVV